MIEFIYNHHPEFFFLLKLRNMTQRKVSQFVLDLKVVASDPSPPIKEEF